MLNNDVSTIKTVLTTGDAFLDTLMAAQRAEVREFYRSMRSEGLSRVEARQLTVGVACFVGFATGEEL